MKKIIYSRLDGGVSIVVPAPKEMLEKALGPMTTQEYEDHVRTRSIPAEATNVRDLEDVDIPTSREFRDAWEDSQTGTQIDISLEKAKEIQLKKLRVLRDTALKENDKEFNIAMKKGQATSEIETKAQALRDATNPLKALDVVGLYNDEAVLQQIRDLAVLPE